MSAPRNENGKRLALSSTNEPTIKLCVSLQDGTKQYWTVKYGRKLMSFFMKYCEKKNLEYNMVHFLLNGKRIKATQTPEEIGLEDEDEITAVYHQTGGGPSEIKV